MLSCFSHVRLFVTLWVVACQYPLCPWGSPGKNTRLDCHALFQVIFLTQGLKLSPVVPALWMDSLPLSHRGSPEH